MNIIIKTQIQNLEKRNQWQQIIDLLKPIVEQEKADAEILRALGFAYSQLDRYDEARYCYKQWLELEPNRAQPYYNIAYTFYDAGQWKEAVEWFDKALEISPDYLVCLYRKGVALYMDGKTRKAKDTLRQAVIVYQNFNDGDFKRRLNKYYYRSIFYLGKSYLGVGSFKNARACFEKVLQEDRRNYIDKLFVKYNLALSLTRLKEFDAAENIVRELASRNQRAEWLYDFWGRLLIDQKRYAEAIEKLNMALRIRMQPYILIDRARANYFSGERAAAKHDLHEALRRDRKGKHKILLELAKIANEEKLFPQAIQFARRAIEFKLKIYEADYAEAHLLLSELYKSVGKEKKAREEYNIAQQIDPQMEWDDELILNSRIVL